MPSSAGFSPPTPVIEWRSIRAWLPCTLGTACVLVAVPLCLDIALARTVCWPEPGIAVVTAVSTVAFTYRTAPQAKLWVAATWWSVGAWLANMAPNLHSYPECHARAYEPVGWPWPLAVATGAVVLALMVWRARRVGARQAAR